MKRTVSRKALRKRRHRRVRRKVHGTPERPRLCVFKSNRYLYLQAIDDTAGRTLAAAATLTRGTEAKRNSSSKNAKAAQSVAEAMAARLKEKAITTLVFDRSGYPYHGRVKAIAEVLRKAGLKL